MDARPAISDAGFGEGLRPSCRDYQGSSRRLRDAFHRHGAKVDMPALATAQANSVPWRSRWPRANGCFHLKLAALIDTMRGHQRSEEATITTAEFSICGDMPKCALEGRRF